MGALVIKVRKLEESSEREGWSRVQPLRGELPECLGLLWAIQSTMWLRIDAFRASGSQRPSKPGSVVEKSHFLFLFGHLLIYFNV